MKRFVLAAIIMAAVPVAAHVYDGGAGGGGGGGGGPPDPSVNIDLNDDVYLRMGDDQDMQCGWSDTVSGFACLDAIGYTSVTIGGGVSGTPTLGSIGIGNLLYSGGDPGFASTSIGFAVDSDGVAAISIGYITNADGDYSVALGTDSAAGSGDYSVAIGGGITGAGDAYAIGIGYGANANNDYSVAIGEDSGVTGLYGVAIGRDSNVVGQAGVAVGYLANQSSGDYGVCIGRQANVSATDAIAIGREAGGVNDYSAAIGYQATTTRANQMMLGTTAQPLNIVTHGSHAQDGPVKTGLTSGVNTPVFSISVPSNSSVGGHIFWECHADDGTDFQTTTGSYHFSAINKAGTETCQISAMGSTSLAASTGSVASFNTFTSGAAANTCEFQMQPSVSGITPTTLEGRWWVRTDKDVTVTPL